MIDYSISADIDIDRKGADESNAIRLWVLAGLLGAYGRDGVTTIVIRPLLDA